ncbi:RHS repeat-associated core domain-containing protein [Chryseobacterium sp. 2R14A]|uniref:RHS repeat-associated core domain-containing protein n=1 Tax=Chryseobacterium sp. 2R14A TaxID=3380353 RepID=UPI003CF71489
MQDAHDMNYVYRADGVKVKKLFGTVQTDYLDGFQYKFTNAWEDETGAMLNDEMRLRIIPTSEGYFDALRNSYFYNFNDHLGNVRLTYSDADGNGTVAGDVLVEECFGGNCSSYIIPGEIDAINNYYPFGMLHNYTATTQSAYQYKYNGKELQETGMYDYGARFYMPDIGRWGVVDPLAEPYRRWSPYNYVMNNPLIYVDPDGREIWIAFDVANKDGSTTQQRVQYKEGKLYGTDGKVYTGENEYATKVMGDLNQLMKDDDVLKDRINTLETSKQTHTIMNTRDYDDSNSNSPLSLDNDRKGIPTGSITRYNPYKETDATGDKRKPRVGLAHEFLSHAWDSDQGKTDYGVTSNGIEMFEVKAVNIENIARAATGDKKKRAYGDKKIPTNLLEDVNKKKK